MNELIVFAKAPRLGEVKTRLAAEIGAAEACEAYRVLLAALRENLGGISGGCVLFSPADGQLELEQFFPGWRFLPQRDGDLGQRMAEALRDSFARGSDRVAIIGSDCPCVRSEDIEAAWAALERADVVFGPAEDGGYWLIGARCAHEGLFEGIEWGTSSVLERNLQNCARLGLSAELLRTLHDVDTRADWERYLAWRGNAGNPATSA